MTLSDWINLSLSAFSLLLAIISVISVVITLRQNHKMIENATRPYIGIKYETTILPHGLERYVVVKNYGQTSAKILQINCTGNADHEYMLRINMLSGTYLTPGQSVIYYFGGSNSGTPEEISISCRYKGTSKKEYQEETVLRLVVGTYAKRSKGEESVSYALQEIADRLL